MEKRTGRRAESGSEAKGKNKHGTDVARSGHQNGRTGTVTEAGGIKPEDWPASKVNLWPLSKVQPYENNPRTHPPAQVDLLAASMMSDGVTAPILIDEAGVIIYGHGRRLAAIKNGFEKYPVVVARGWTEEQKRAVRLKDNAVALLSGWDRELIRHEVAELKLTGYDVSLLGFGEAQLVQFMTTPAPPDQFPEYGSDIPTEYCCPKCAYRWSGSPGGSDKA